MRLLAEDASYSRQEGRNVLSLTLLLDGAQAGTDPERAGAAERDFAGKAPPGFFQRIRMAPSVWRSNLAVKQTLFLGLSTAIIVWAGIFFFHRSVNEDRAEAAKMLSRRTMQTLDSAASRLFGRLAAETGTLARYLGEHETADPKDDFESLPLTESAAQELAGALLAEDAVIGIIYTDQSRFQEWLLIMRDGVLMRMRLPSTFTPAWLARAGDAAEPDWQGPILDIPGDIPGKDAAMFLCLPWGSKDAKRRGRPEEDKPGGTIGILVGMPEIADLLRSVSGFPMSEAFLLNENGEYLIFPPERSRHEGPANIFVDARTSRAPLLMELGQAVLRGEEGSLSLPLTGEEAALPWPVPWQGQTTMLYQPMREAGHPRGVWLGLLLPAEELGELPAPMSLGMALVAFFGPIAFAFLVWRVTSQTLRPVRELSTALENMAEGDLNSPLPEPLRPDETGSMLQSFERARLTLRVALRNLINNAAAQERLSNELAVARAIQESILATNFPVLPGMDVCARIDMAREVCGDLYDCFVMDLAATEGGGAAPQQRLCCVVGDVSGKGVPAAMLMSGAISLARAALLEGLEPAAVLVRVNEALVRSIRAGMFVTMLVGVIDPLTGNVVWAAAGHPPPMRARVSPAGGDGGVHIDDWPGELALGIKSGRSYSSFSFVLEPGEALLLYTDGATEAVRAPGRGKRRNAEEENFYGEDRLARSLLQRLDTPDARSLLEGIRMDLFAHMAGAAPHDDVTLMVIRRW